jgi:hypothetical protein
MLMRRHLQNGAIFADDLSNIFDIRKRYDVVGNPDMVPSALGPIVHYDGEFDYIATRLKLLVTSKEYSWCTWLTPDRNDTSNTFIGDTGGSGFWGAYFDSADTLSFSMGGFTTGVDSYRNIPFDIELGLAVHVIFTWDGTSMKAYKNGIQVGVTTPITTPVDWPNEMLLGTKFIGSAAVGFYQGAQGDMVVWPKALSDVEAYGMFSGDLY